jgi:hypothetical protein
VVRHLVRAVVAHVGDQDVLGSSCFHVHYVHPDSVAGDHFAPLHGGDGPGADPGVLVDHRVAVPAYRDQVLLGFGLNRDHLDPSLVEDCGFNVHITEVVIRNYCL